MGRNSAFLLHLLVSWVFTADKSDTHPAPHGRANSHCFYSRFPKVSALREALGRWSRALKTGQALPIFPFLKQVCKLKPLQGNAPSLRWLQHPAR